MLLHQAVHCVGMWRDQGQAGPTLHWGQTVDISSLLPTILVSTPDMGATWFGSPGQAFTSNRGLALRESRAGCKFSTDDLLKYQGPLPHSCMGKVTDSLLSSPTLKCAPKQLEGKVRRHSVQTDDAHTSLPAPISWCQQERWLRTQRLSSCGTWCCTL